jgi:hypothetical protein
MKLRVLSVVVKFSLLPFGEFCVQDAPRGGWFIVMLEQMLHLPGTDTHPAALAKGITRIHPARRGASSWRPATDAPH